MITKSEIRKELNEIYPIISQLSTKQYMMNNKDCASVLLKAVILLNRQARFIERLLKENTCKD
jgi:hypothetical protein